MVTTPLTPADFLFFFSFFQDVYNFLLDSGMDPVSADTPAAGSSAAAAAAASNVQALRYSTYLGTQDSAGSSNTISGIMNGVIKEKLKIVPKDLK